MELAEEHADVLACASSLGEADEVAVRIEFPHDRPGRQSSIGAIATHFHRRGVVCLRKQKLTTESPSLPYEPRAWWLRQATRATAMRGERASRDRSRRCLLRTRSESPAPHQPELRFPMKAGGLPWG